MNVSVEETYTTVIIPFISVRSSAPAHKDGSGVREASSVSAMRSPAALQSEKQPNGQESQQAPWTL